MPRLPGQWVRTVTRRRSQPENQTERLTTIDALRGLASFAVCWYHLVFANHAFAGSGLIQATLRDSARNAWVGVDVFFVISGFIIPLALCRARYVLSSYGRFVLKRIVRLDPPYLVSIVVCIALAYLSASAHRLHGAPVHLSPLTVLLHIGYLNAFSGKPWLNPVYWTLAIEFQYYVGMGLLFVLLASRQKAARWALFIGLGALAFLEPSPNLLFHYLFVFMLGMSTFQYRVGLLSLRVYLPLLAALAAGCYLTLGPLVTGAGLCAALAIAFIRSDIRPLVWLGSLSYSLYLVHVPIGGRAMNLLLPHAHGMAARCLVLAFSLALSVFLAYGLYRIVERPAQRWSSAIRYRSWIAAAGEQRASEGPHGAVTGVAEP